MDEEYDVYPQLSRLPIADLGFLGYRVGNWAD